MLLGSVSSQERFGVTDIKAPLGVSQLLGLGQTVLQLSGLEWTIIALRQISVIAPCYSSILFRRQQENPSLRCEAMSIQRRKVQGREREPFGSSFYMFFPSPWACPMQIGLSQECCLFYLKSSLWSSDLPLTFLCSIFAGSSLPCLLDTAILDSFFLF